MNDENFLINFSSSFHAYIRFLVERKFLLILGTSGCFTPFSAIFSKEQKLLKNYSLGIFSPFRQAVAYAINRKRMKTNIYQGLITDERSLLLSSF
ncbi:hypothetical protein F7734_29015 [Scytonema sp. UIC 10036]|uniref:hypothetical protein n=1 Tax=Scytonema sp. UIC 10036 TaxID=2304196 RepID=UPI0012DA8483|nr:hypothetical protein [Scytonema sp. UIC 10036]MUG96165.1 hypothetical protein [Scytonema sp. UIC 10036]